LGGRGPKGSLISAKWRRGAWRKRSSRENLVKRFQKSPTRGVLEIGGVANFSLSLTCKKPKFGTKSSRTGSVESRKDSTSGLRTSHVSGNAGKGRFGGQLGGKRRMNGFEKKARGSCGGSYDRGSD